MWWRRAISRPSSNWGYEVLVGTGMGGDGGYRSGQSGTYEDIFFRLVGVVFLEVRHMESV